MKREKQKEATLDPLIFEYAMSHWFADVSGKSEVNYCYNRRFIVPFTEAGYVERIATKDLSKYQRAYPEGEWYRPTAAGLRWWFAERVRVYSERECPHDPVSLVDTFEFMGVGSEVQLPAGFWGGPIFAALEAGYLEFISHRDYYPLARGHEEYITVRLTKAGQEFFDSVPRLQLECA